MYNDEVINTYMQKVDYVLLTSDHAVSNSSLSDDMYAIAYLDEGCEGCYLNFYVHCDDRMLSVGTIKTLHEGQGTWRWMGMLAGEMAWLANQYICYNT